MPSEAKVRALQVRPIQSADLSFETPGVIWSQNAAKARLGQSVAAFDARALVADLRATTRDVARLRYDAAEMRAVLQSDFLFALRNDALAVALQQGVVAREIAHLQKYSHIAQIVAAAGEVYPADPKKATGKLARLRAIGDLAQKHRDALTKAYTHAGKTSVETSVASTTATSGSGNSTTTLTPVAIRNPTHVIRVSGAAPSDHTVDQTQAIPQKFNAGVWEDLTGGELSFKSQQTVVNNESVKVTNKTDLVEFRHPLYENQITAQRIQANLQDELLTSTVVSYQVPHLQRILERELEAVDLNIAQAQLRFLQTFLLSPISGVITAIYKDVGEAVQPGEAVVRVENRERLLLVGLMRSRELIRLGQPVTVETRLYEGTGQVAVRGTVVSVRGHEADDDEWDVIIEIPDEPQLPLNYQLDRDSTVVRLL